MQIQTVLLNEFFINTFLTMKRLDLHAILAGLDPTELLFIIMIFLLELNQISPLLAIDLFLSRHVV